MSDLAKDFMNLQKDFKTRANSLVTLVNDLESMENGIKKEEPYSRQTVEPMTRLRKNTKDLEVAKKSPDEQFVRDRIHDILGI